MKTIEYADVVADLSWGDTGKGKITSALVRKNNYDFVCRWAGGNNAGHTVIGNGNAGLTTENLYNLYKSKIAALYTGEPN